MGPRRDSVYPMRGRSLGEGGHLCKQFSEHVSKRRFRLRTGARVRDAGEAGLQDVEAKNLDDVPTCCVRSEA